MKTVHSKTKALRAAYDVLLRMQVAKLQPPDEVDEWLLIVVFVLKILNYLQPSHRWPGGNLHSACVIVCVSSIVTQEWKA